MQIAVGDLVFEAAAAGEGGGELVLMLHGFPQTSHSWRFSRRPVNSRANSTCTSVATMRICVAEKMPSK